MSLFQEAFQGGMIRRAGTCADKSEVTPSPPVATLQPAPCHGKAALSADRVRSGRTQVDPELGDTLRVPSDAATL